MPKSKLHTVNVQNPSVFGFQRSKICPIPKQFGFTERLTFGSIHKSLNRMFSWDQSPECPKSEPFEIQTRKRSDFGVVWISVVQISVIHCSSDFNQLVLFAVRVC